MNNNNEDQIKKQLFGTVGKIPCKGGFTVDNTELIKPFEWHQAVIRSFCEGCGFTLEINEEVAKELAEKADIELPSSPNSYYFITKNCCLCDGQDETVKLRKISFKVT